MEMGHKHGQANQLGNLGFLAAQRGEVENARDLLNQAKGLFESTGSGGPGPQNVTRALEVLAAAGAAQPTPKPRPPRKKRPPKKPPPGKP